VDIAQYMLGQFEQDWFIVDDKNSWGRRAGFVIYFGGSHSSFRQPESTSESSVGKQIAALSARSDYGDLSADFG
jgi:hypothetical protein